jgi:hypothetical protein
VHQQTFTHPQPNPLCPRGPFCGEHERYDAEDKERRRHRKDFTHVCPYGMACRDKGRPDHSSEYLHLSMAVCPAEAAGGKCNEIWSESHLNLYAHSGFRNIRQMCRHQDKCRDRRKVAHLQIYQHLASQPMVLTNAQVTLGVIPAFRVVPKPTATDPTATKTVACAATDGDPFEVDNGRNHRNVARLVRDHLGARPNVRAEVKDWVSKLRPQHRCRLEIFKSMLVHGSVMSLAHMHQLNTPVAVRKEMHGHPELREIARTMAKANGFAPVSVRLPMPTGVLTMSEVFPHRACWRKKVHGIAHERHYSCSNRY